MTRHVNRAYIDVMDLEKELALAVKQVKQTESMLAARKSYRDEIIMEMLRVGRPQNKIVQITELSRWWINQIAKKNGVNASPGYQSRSTENAQAAKRRKATSPEQ